MGQTILTLDFETYYDDDYSLRKISILEYIRDPRFKVHGAGVKVGDTPATWITGSDLPAFFEGIPWRSTTVISHNALFDHTVLHEKYGISPGRRIDTLGLCRALLPRDLDFDLEIIAPLLGIGEKGKELVLSKGLRELPPNVEEKIAGYACNDADLAYGIYKLLWPEMPDSYERDVLNLVLRMSTEGVLRYDLAQSAEAKQEIIDHREEKLAKLPGVTEKMLRSRDQFAGLLRRRGVEPPTKISPTTGKETYAFSKQDPAFVALRADPRVADLVQAREAWASNNAITRIERLERITSQPPHTLPVMLQYAGAHTGRFSGGGKINMQNLNARGVGSRLRKAITAPPGHVIVVRDLSGIELRMNMWFSGQHDVLDFIREGGDVYILEASRQFNVPYESIDKKTPEGNKKRQIGKIITLGAGFQMSWTRFKDFAAAGPLGVDPVYLSDAEAYQRIMTYRANHRKVVESWYWLNDVAIPAMTQRDAHLERGPVVVGHESIRLPNGLSLQYPSLRATEDGWVWGLNGRLHNIYGGIVQENIVQALAGCVIKEQMIQIDRELGGATFHEALVRGLDKAVNARGSVVHQVHDEILVVCRERDADDISALMGEIMSTPVAWAPDLPLESEGGYSYRYEK